MLKRKRRCPAKMRLTIVAKYVINISSEDCMIFDKLGKVYSKMEFLSEDEIEKVVLNNFKLLFGDYSILLDKNLITTNSGKGTVPDGIIIDLFNNHKNDIMTVWEEEKRKRMQKRFFLSGCTG
jgi:hypothetical protein